jgi:thymidine kinase
MVPLKILQSSDRVAEVQFICDYCGKIVRTSVMTKEETEAKKDTKITCCQCKTNPKNKK